MTSGGSSRSWPAWARGVVPAALLLVVAASAAGQPPVSQEASSALASLPVPGGTAALANLAGIDEATPRGLVLLQVIRALHDSPAGSDPARDARLERLRAYLADGSGLPGDRDAPRDERMSAGQGPDEVPLPLDARLWERLVNRDGGGKPTDLLAALLSDRRASLLYYGLMSLDGPSRAYIGANPGLLAKLAEGGRPAVLASLGRSIRVRGGVVDVPGGAPAAPLWEALLRERASEPGPFILELLERDRGRVALLYDLVDHLDPPRQAFVLGLREPDPGTRIDRFRALLDAFAPSLGRWEPDVRPFRRVPYDAVHLLATMRVQPGGELPAPAGRRFWSAVFAGPSLPADPVKLVNAGEPDVPADAAWLVAQISVENPVRRQQALRTWQFSQRVFAGAPPAALPQALVALRGFARFPMLLLTLERIGIRDPEVYAAAVRHAQRLSEIGDRDAMTTSLRQFQAALAIVERICFSRAVSPQVATRLAQDLTNVQVSEDGSYLGAIGAWLDTRVLPALPPLSELGARQARTSVSDEATLLAAMAGVSPGAVAPVVEWEGLRYRVDVGAASFSRLVRIRQKQGGRTLDGVLGLVRDVGRLGSATPSPTVVMELSAALTSSVTGLVDQPKPSVGEDTESGLREILNEALNDLRKVRSPKDSASLTRVYHPLQRACDLLLASVLGSLAYAPHLGDPEGPELLAGDPAGRHSFGFDERIAEIRSVNPWRMPQRTYGVSGGWHVTGALLGLDVGLAPLELRRVATDGLPPAPHGNEIDRASIASAVALSSPFAVSDSQRDALADALRRGRARVNGLSAHPSALPALARAARLNEWLSTVLPWALEHEPERAGEYFSLADLVRIGDAEAAPSDPPDDWGAPRLDTDGCICLRYPVAGVRDTLAGRTGTALVTEQFEDLTLRIAESLAGLGLPAPLARSILSLAAQDVLDTYRPAYIDDWTALEAAVRRLPESRFADYIAALTAGGPLVPDEPARADDVRR